MNEQTSGTAVNCLKPWHERADASRFVLSADDDPEMIIVVPFKCAVTIRSFTLAGGGAGGSAPSRVRLFVDREDVDFTTGHELPPAQECAALPEDPEARVDNPLRPGKFRSVSCLTLFVVDSHDGDASRINFLGFKGKATKLKREPVVAVYEVRPTPESTDHVQGLRKLVS